jgi:hypothetical protein
MMERISHQDAGFGQQRGVAGHNRRDDLLSMNNLSIDMFNIGRNGA